MSDYIEIGSVTLLPAGTTYTSPDGTVRDVVIIRELVLDRATAEALAAARIARAGSDLLAADAKPTAHAVADALVAAGLGGS